jgi:hypothetical protein
MVAISRFEKVYFAAVGVLALWVGVWGYLIPARVDAAIPWLVPPLHARFLGAVYFSAFVLLACGILARRYGEVRTMVPLITIWTGMLLALSIVHLDQFDFGRRPVWFWFGAYIVYPIVGLYLIFRHRNDREALAGERVPAWIRRACLALGGLLALAAAALLFAPAAMAALWPWKIPILLAQIYSAPFLAYGVCIALLGREPTWPGLRVVARGAFALSSLALLASILHRGLFDAGRPATWIWFGFFSVATPFFWMLTLRSFRQVETP